MEQGEYTCMYLSWIKMSVGFPSLFSMINAYFCILHIPFAHLEILGFPMGQVPTNTGIFLCSLKLCGESRT